MHSLIHFCRLAFLLEQVNQSLENHTKQLNDIARRLERIQYAPSNRANSPDLFSGGISERIVIKSVIFALIGLTFSLILRWLFK